MRNVFLSIIVLFIAGCSNTGPKLGQLGKFTKYFDENLQIQEVTFVKEKKLNANLKIPSVSEAGIKIAFGNSFTTKPIGKMYQLDENRSNMIVNLETGKNINPNSQEDLMILKTTTALKIYEISKNNIETIIYGAADGVCNAWSSFKPVYTKSITNYYEKGKDDFFGNIIKANLNANGKIRILDFNSVFSTKDEKEIIKIKKFIQSQNFKKLAQEDIKKQGRILFFLCL